jgi:3-oxoacyl-(acyl-carrier-protein) synthase
MTSIRISSYSIGLPGNDLLFTDDSIETIFQGNTKIEQITESDINQTKIYTSALPTRLGSKLSSIDLKKKYNVPSHVIDSCDEMGHYSIASGIEVFSKLGISLYNSKGRLKGLPYELQNTTGIISIGLFTPFATLQRIIQNQSTCVKDVYKLTVMPCAHLASLLRAKGPSLHINAACCSTIHAISIAQDWIRSGRCKRVLVVGCDQPVHPTLSPIISAVFQDENLISTQDNVSLAACPFDQNRSGMILGDGTFGILLEENNQPGIYLLDTFVFTTCYNIVSLDGEILAEYLSKFITQICKTLNTTLEQLSSDLLYFSHESLNPSCARAEIEMLQLVFDSHLKNIIICSTKGYTGHCMGVSLEDPIAILCLEQKRIPPIPNLVILDHSLGDIKLSQGETNITQQYVLRFSMGLGSYTGFAFYQRR